MKPFIKNTSLSLLINIVGIGTLVAGILLMSLQHDMSWQSYVVIGVIMLIALWTMFTTGEALKFNQKRVPVSRDKDNFIKEEETLDDF